MCDDNSELPVRPVTGADKRGKHNRELMKKNAHGLNLRQQLFVAYYLEQGCKNAYQAALRAGYSESNARLATVNILGTPQVKSELARRMGLKFKNLDISADKVLREIALMAYSNILDFIEIDPQNGTFSIDLRKLDRDTAAAISEVYYDSEGRPRVKLHNKQAALELLGRYFKMFNSELPKGAGVTENGEPLTVQSLDRIIQQTVNIYNQQITVQQGPTKTPQQLEAEVELPKLVEGDSVGAQL